MQTNKIDWIYPNQRNTYAGDVQISIWKRKNASEELFISFSNDAAKRIGSDRVVVGKLCDRMYFMPLGSGFKLSQSSKNRKSFKAVGIDHCYTAFIGQHELMYDEHERLYYISEDKR